MVLLESTRFLETLAIIVLSISYCFFGAETTQDLSTPAFVNYYEVIHYKIQSLEDKEWWYSTIKQSYTHGLTFAFSAFKRSFSVMIWPDKHIFQPNVRITISSKNDDETKWLRENLIYKGFLKGEQGSRVSGYIAYGSFTGLMTIRDKETLYTEPLLYGSENNQEGNSSLIRAIIYKDMDINYNYTKGSYGVRLQKAAPGREMADQTQTKHTKRLAQQYNSCPVLLAADSSFHKNVGNNLQITLAKMSYHLSEADRLFRRTKLVKESDEDGLGLVIAAMKVYKDKESEGIFTSEESVNVEDFLEQWSTLNHSAYCLSLLFTYRDFPNGVLGLAWLADLNTLGGICEPWNSYYNQSFNTAVVTFLNNGQFVAEKVGTITVAHELAHGFGAKHDPTSCQPNGNQGNYIMYEHATDAVHPNNDQFSECSIKNMEEVIEKKAHNCFTDGRSYCGNQIIESGEECDCGSVEECETHDPCCVARDDKNGITGCLLKPTAKCSPLTGPCCTNQCEIINVSEKIVCQKETECSFKSFCENGSCPVAQAKPDNKMCNNGSNVCRSGQCSGSICIFYGHKECPCIDPENSCQVCCNNSKGECVSSAEFTGRIVAQPLKTACDVNGYCDGSGHCIRHVDKPDKQHDGSFEMVLTWFRNKWYIFLFVGLTSLANVSYIAFYKCRQYTLRRARRRTSHAGGLEIPDMERNSQDDAT